MSDFRAIAAVTAALRHLVLEGVRADVPGAEVTTVRPGAPGSAGTGSGLPRLGVNVHLYASVPLPAFRDHRPPVSGAGGAGEPAATALELHYLLSFHGDDARLEPQRLLGSTLVHLAAQAVLTRARIAAALADPAVTFLAGADLAEQQEMVRLTPLVLSLEEMARLWSGLLGAPHALSVAWRAAPVLVAPRAPAGVRPGA